RVRGPDGRLAVVRRSQGEVLRPAAARRGRGKGAAQRAARRARDPRGPPLGRRRRAGRRRVVARREGSAHRRPRFHAARARPGSRALARPGARLAAHVQCGRQRGRGWRAATRGGAPRVLVGLEGSLDSLGLEARASVERLQWRSWAVPRGRVRFAYRPGAVPVFELEATLDSLAHGVLGFGAAAASVRGTRDSLTWFARSRVGEGAAFLAGG